jgi:hypothetical protein
LTRIILNKQFETSKYLNTQSGKDLQGALEYISQFAEITLRTLRGGVGAFNYVDNFDCQIKVVGLISNQEQIVLSQPVRKVSEVRLRQVINQQYYLVESFGWKYDNTGNIVVKTVFANSPPTTENINVELLILFG